MNLPVATPAPHDPKVQHYSESWSTGCAVCDEAIAKSGEWRPGFRDPDPLHVPEDVWRGNDTNIASRTIRAPWNREEGTAPSRIYHLPGDMSPAEVDKWKAELQPSRRTLYLAIGSGFLLGLGVGIVVRR